MTAIPRPEHRADGSRMDYLQLVVLDERRLVVARVPTTAPEPVTTQALARVEAECAQRFPGYRFRVLRVEVTA